MIADLVPHNPALLDLAESQLSSITALKRQIRIPVIQGFRRK
jgi:hypothetical protein